MISGGSNPRRPGYNLRRAFCDVCGVTESAKEASRTGQRQNVDATVKEILMTFTPPRDAYLGNTTY